MYLPSLKLRWIVLFAGLAMLMIGTEISVAQSAMFGRRPDWLSLGITIDMAVVLPALYYLLIVRKVKVPARSLLVVIGAGLTLTALILPANQQQLVGLLRRSLMLIELGSVGYVLIRIGQIRKHYCRLNASGADFMVNLLKSLDATLGHSRFNRILVSELSVLRYGLFGWAIPVEKTETDTAFTSHRQSGQMAFTAGLVFVGLIETFGVHLLINRWSPLGAWLATAAGFYSLLFFVADLVATIKRPILVGTNNVVLRFGLRGYGQIDREQIEHVIRINDKPTRHAETMNGAFLSTPTVLITLREPVMMTGPLGIPKRVKRIALTIDDNNKFIQDLTA